MSRIKTGFLRRELRLGGAILMEMGAILDTGVFVSIGMAPGIADSAVIIAALLALCNALSAAQLAAAHPVSGGTYEYGY